MLRHVIIVGATLVTHVLLAVPAWAHVDPDPPLAQAGGQLSVGFTVLHGCDGSPTIQLDMRLPDGVVEPDPEPPAGWSGSVAGNVVTFTGGPLAATEELTFRVRMTLPPTPDTTIYFPFVQRCETGEIRWIDVPTDGSGNELDEPAPAMRLFGPAATTTAPATTVPVATTTLIATSTTSVATMVQSSSSVTSSVQPATSADADVATTAATEVDGGGDGSGTAIFIGTVVAVALLGAVAAVQVRRRR